MSTSSLSNVCTLTDPNSVLDTVNSLEAPVLAMQQQMQNMTNLMQNSLMSPQGTNHDQQLTGNREQTQSMDSVNRVQVTRQFINAAAVHKVKIGPQQIYRTYCVTVQSVLMHAIQVVILMYLHVMVIIITLLQCNMH